MTTNPTTHRPKKTSHLLVWGSFALVLVAAPWIFGSSLARCWIRCANWARKWAHSV